MDAAFTPAPFGTLTTAEIKAAILAGSGRTGMIAELRRREAVKAGDVSAMTPAERLRFIRAGGSI